MAGQEPLRGIDRGASPMSRPTRERPARDITTGNAERIGKNLEDLLGSGPTHLEIDLRKVTYLSGDGGAVFVMALRAARAHGTRVIATHVGPQARGSLKQLGLLRVFDVHEGDGPSCSRGSDE